MKELEKNRTENESVSAEHRPIKKRAEFIGRLKYHKGQIVWQINLDTLVITKAEFEKVEYKLPQNGDIGTIHKKVIALKGHLYCAAINRKNAIKKFSKMLKKILDDTRSTELPAEAKG